MDRKAHTERKNKTMLKVHILSRRRSDMTHEQYVAYWRDVHAPLFASQPDVKRYVRRYIQCFITGDRPAGPNLGETDGIRESVAAGGRAGRSPRRARRRSP